MTSKTHRLALLPVLLPSLLAVGCGSGSSPGSTLEAGIFSYRCVDAADAHCNQGAPSSWPSRIATGSRFGVSYAPHDPSADPLAMELVDEARASLADLGTEPELDGGISSTITTTAPGYATLLIRAQQNVLDLYTVELLEPDSLSLRVNDEQGASLITAEGAAGATLTLDFNVVPAEIEVAPTVDDDHFAVAGSLPWSWTTSDESVIRFTGPTDAAKVPIEAHAGQATLTVSTGDLVTTMEVTVP